MTMITRAIIPNNKGKLINYQLHYLQGMKKIYILIIILSFGCSPYKKVTISMSQIQTNNWMNKTEQEVVSKLGAYKRKETTAAGYTLFFDFSTYVIPRKILATNNYSLQVSNNSPVDKQGRLQQPRTEFASSAAKTSAVNQLQEVANLKTLEFYFDKNNKVSYVFASGYPDSVRYELRKK